MTLKNISSGIRVANYKELCKLLEEPVKAGNSKKAQLKDFEKYFAYEKDKNAYIITEIYDVPQLKEDGRQKYLQLLEPIILNYLAMQKGCHLESWNKWFQKFGMINPEFYDESCGEAERLYWGANPHSLFLLRNIAKNRMKEILSGTLANMKKRGLIDYTEGWNVVSVTGFSYFKTEAEATVIKRIYQEVMSEMGYSSMSAIYLSPKRLREFEDKLHEKFLERGWRNVFRAVKIEAASDIIDKYAGMDTRAMRKNLNKDVSNAVRKAARTMAQNAENKDWEKLSDFTDEEWNEHLEKSFFLPRSFADDADVLAEFLMHT